MPLRSTLLLLCTLLVSACSPAPAPLRLGTNLWLGYEPIYVAREKAWLNEADVNILEFGTSMDVIRGLRAGTLDAGALTLDEALVLAGHLPDLKIGLVLDYSNGADALLTRPNIQDLADLRGRKVGVENTGTGSYVLSRALASAGLTMADIRLVPLAYDEHLEAFRKGRVEAVVTYEPARSELLKQGAISLFDTRRIPGEVVDVLVYRDTARRESLAHLGEAWCRAMAWQQQNPSGFISLVQSRQRQTTGELNQGFSDIHLVDCNENRNLFHAGRQNLIEQAKPLEKHLRTAFPDEKIAPLGKVLGPIPLPAKDLP